VASVSSWNINLRENLGGKEKKKNRDKCLECEACGVKEIRKNQRGGKEKGGFEANQLISFLDKTKIRLKGGKIGGEEEERKKRRIRNGPFHAVASI